MSKTVHTTEIQNKKKGGPYTKDNQESRRNEVYRLHFEYGYSARKISEIMKVNRNTINSDIKYCYKNINEELKQNKEDLILQQLRRLESQRTRIIEAITNEKNDSIKYEKLLLDLDVRINNILMRIKSEQQEIAKSTEDNVPIKDIALFLVIKHSKNPCLKKEDILSELVNIQQCTMSRSDELFSEMKELGLECCKKFRSAYFEYDLLEFALLRKYIEPNSDFVTKIHALCLIHNHFDTENIRLNKKYEKNHGGKESWSDEIFSKFEDEKKQIVKSHATTSAEIVLEASEVIEEDEIINYIKYINVFFGKNDKTLFESMLD